MTESGQIRHWWIYKITSPSGRIYIGKTKCLKNRLRQYRTGSHKKINTAIYRSITKYGFLAHKFEILEELLCGLRYANDKEMFWIRGFMANINKYPSGNGLNLTNGGDGSAGFKHTNEWKKKNSELHSGKKHLLGYKFSEESLAKRSLSQRGKKLNPDKVKERTRKLIEAIGKKIVCSYGGHEKEYSSLVEAVRETGVSHTQFYRSVKSGKPTKGIKFKYKTK